MIRGSTDEDSTSQSDTLLWLGGALVVGMGVIWLVLSRPWAGDATELQVTVEEPAVQLAAAPAPAPGTRTELENSLEGNPLRMAELAYEAGMLVEPGEYSAWTLYQRALEEEPDSEAAREGLENIAEELLRRASAAVEQGRFDDARATIERIRSAIPVHPAANELAFRIDELAPRPRPRPEPSRVRAAASNPAEPSAEAPPAQVRAAVEPPTQAAQSAPAEPGPESAPRADPALAPHEAFVAALARNQLLTPAGDNAKHFLGVLTFVAADHELTRQARSRLFVEFLARATEAIDALDADAASTWIDEADLLAVDPVAVDGVRRQLRDQLIAIESGRRVPASALKVVSYTPPEFPERALQRGLDGWVDIDFTIARDGSTREVTVTESSHNAYFRNEAVRAVERWRFEPRVFMGEAIEQRSYTRIRFDFE